MLILVSVGFSFGSGAPTGPTIFGSSQISTVAKPEASRPAPASKSGESYMYIYVNLRNIFCSIEMRYNLVLF